MEQSDVNFRPSPNFKNMKKYSKSNNQTMEKDMNTVNTSTEAPEVNPPLPTYPHPDVQIKQEVVDDGYESQSNKMTEQGTQENETAKTEGAEKEVIMCKNFFRGACNRGASCIFAHKVILSQLSEVYRFCNDFQNSKCTRPKCRFVHATVFEKEHFLRTGYLPPHALEHIKETTKQSPPPATTENNEGQPYNFNVPNTSAVSLSSNIPSALPIPVSTAGANVYSGVATTPGQSFTGGWVGYDANTNQQLDLAGSVAPSNTCSECDINEFRLQYNKNKLENLKRANEELDAKISSINNKTKRMMMVMEAIIKPLNMAQTSALLNINPEVQAMSNLHARLALQKMKRGHH